MNATTKNPTLATCIRWMIRKDMPDVLAMEAACSEFPWGEGDFMRCLRQRNSIGIVATINDNTTVVGFTIYELHKSRLHVLNFAVHEDYRYKGVGAAMVNKLKSKLSDYRRARIMLEIRETNLGAQLFFRRMGFRCVSVLRQFYEDTPEDAFLFQHRYRDCEGA